MRHYYKGDPVRVRLPISGETDGTIVSRHKTGYRVAYLGQNHHQDFTSGKWETFTVRHIGFFPHNKLVKNV